MGNKSILQKKKKKNHTQRRTTKIKCIHFCFIQWNGRIKHEIGIQTLVKFYCLYNWFVASLLTSLSLCFITDEVKSFSRVWLFVTPWTVACQAPLSMGLLQATVLEWIAISFSRGSCQPRDRTQVSHILDRCFTVWATREVCNPNKLRDPWDSVSEKCQI